MRFNGISILHPSYVSIGKGTINLQSDKFRFLGINYPLKFMNYSLMDINISDKIIVWHDKKINVLKDARIR